MTTTVFNRKISEVESKIPTHDKYITTPEFNKSTTENFVARSKQFSTKSDFDKKLISFNKWIISNKTKRLEVQKKLNKFFLGRIYFASNDGSQDTYVYRPTLNTLKLKKDKSADYVLSWKSKEVFNSKPKPLYTKHKNLWI